MDTSAAYTKAALFCFLRKAETTGLYKANTVGGLRAAATKLLEDVGDGDDVRTFNVEEAGLRYHNRHPSELSPTSLAEYQRRLRRLIDEFAAFNENPAGYRPKGRIARGQAGKGNGDADQKPAHATRPSRTSETQPSSGSDMGHAPATGSAPTVPMLRLSYPIRDDVLAEIAVPRGMTTDEAKRLCAFVMTLAKDFAPA
jgi:hypothetical protein